MLLREQRPTERDEERRKKHRFQIFQPQQKPATTLDPRPARLTHHPFYVFRILRRIYTFYVEQQEFSSTMFFQQEAASFAPTTLRSNDTVIVFSMGEKDPPHETRKGMRTIHNGNSTDSKNTSERFSSNSRNYKI